MIESLSARSNTANCAALTRSECVTHLFFVFMGERTLQTFKSTCGAAATATATETTKLGGLKEAIVSVNSFERSKVREYLFSTFRNRGNVPA